MGFLYKYRLFATPAFFFIVLIGATVIWGGRHCRDGWESPSIGRQGACSHHGGVTSNGPWIFLLSLVAAGVFYVVLDTRYCVHGRYIVRSALPPHPAEAELRKYDEVRDYELAKKVGISGTQWSCTLCNQVFAAGIRYRYAGGVRYHIRYCIDCAEKLPALNVQAASTKPQREQMRTEVEQYYSRNAVGLAD